MLFCFLFLLFVCLMTSVIHKHYFALELFDNLNVINFFCKM